jgi:hypothetical protein
MNPCFKTFLICSGIFIILPPATVIHMKFTNMYLDMLFKDSKFLNSYEEKNK